MRTPLGDLAVFPVRLIHGRKIPRVKEWQTLSGARQVEPPSSPDRWWELVGVTTGELNGLDCLDVDLAGMSWAREHSFKGTSKRKTSRPLPGPPPCTFPAI
jgi:hypothetical protein